MRPIYALVLVVGACGDNLNDADGGPDLVDGVGAVAADNGTGNDPGVDPGTQVAHGGARYTAELCSVVNYPQYRHDGLDVDLAVSPANNGGTAFFSVSRFGGPIRGFATDGRGTAVSDKTGTVLRSDDQFRAISASYIDGRVITTALGDGGTYVDMHRGDLGARIPLAHAAGTLISDLAMQPSMGTRAVAVADEGGISALAFKSDWTTDLARSVARAKPESMTSANFGTEGVVAYAEGNRCHLQRLSGGEMVRAFGCEGSRLAIEQKLGQGHLVFEQDGTIMISNVWTGHSVELSLPTKLVESGFAPRIVWDGTRYWVSYLDPHGYPVVGFLEQDGHLRTHGIGGLSPLDDAYELVLVNGQVWLYAVDRLGLSGVHLCALPVPTDPSTSKN